MSRRILVNGQTLLTGGSQLLEREWHELITWEHAWDAKDAVAYFGGAHAKWPAISDATRVAMVPDRGKASIKRPLLRDSGAIGAGVDNYTFPPNPGHPALPGPKWLASSPRFNGRACWRTDMAEDLAPGAYADKVFSGLAIFSLPAGQTWDTSMSLNPPNGIPVPYWEAVLVRGDTDQVTGSNPAGAKDTGQGHLGDGPTVSIGDPNWIIYVFTGNGSGSATFNTSYIDHSTGTGNVKNESVLAIFSIQGTADSNESFVELNWKDTAGGLHTTRQNFDAFTTNGVPQIPPYRDPFSGIVHTSYVSAWGIKTGIPSEADINTIRSWAWQYIPAASSLAQE